MIEALTWKAAASWLGRNWLPIVILVAIVAGLWFVDHRGFARAKAQDEARLNERRLITAAVVRAIDGELDRQLATIASSSSGKIQTIETEGKTVVQPIIMRELARDPSLARPGSCLTPSLLTAVNAARGYRDDEPAGAGADARPAAPASVPGSPARH
jgi:hypothetical protein